MEKKKSLTRFQRFLQHLPYAAISAIICLPIRNVINLFDCKDIWEPKFQVQNYEFKEEKKLLETNYRRQIEQISREHKNDEKQLEENYRRQIEQMNKEKRQLVSQYYDCLYNSQQCINNTSDIIDFVEKQYSDMVDKQTELFGMLKVYRHDKQRRKQKKMKDEMEINQRYLRNNVDFVKDEIILVENNFNSLNLDTVLYSLITYDMGN